jgi:hypothetical protein
MDIVPKKPNPAPRQFEVGDKIRVSMHGGKIVDAVIAEVGTMRNFSGNRTNQALRVKYDRFGSIRRVVLSK